MSDDIYYLRKAQAVLQSSDDPSTKVGVVIALADQRKVVYGVNSLPTGIKRVVETLPREEKLDLIVHAELDAICTAARYGDQLLGSTMYLVARTGFMNWGAAPCHCCAKHAIAAGIRRFVTIRAAPPTRWVESVLKGRALLEEAGILYEEVDYAKLAD